MSTRYIFLIFALSFLLLPSYSHKLEAEQEAEEEDVPVADSPKPGAHHVLEEDTGEFVGEPIDKEPAESKAKEKSVSTTPSAPIEVRPIEPPQVWYKRYFFEMFFVGLMVIYAVQFYLGQKYNKSTVGAWLAKNLDYFKEQFASIGIDQQQDPNAAKNIPYEGETMIRGALIEQHSYNLFKFYATGRINCTYCLTTIELKRRQDLFTMATFNLLWPEVDRVSYEVPLSFADPFPCVFAIVRRNEMKAILENNKVLKDHTTQRHVEGLSPQFAVLSEYDEIVEHILTPPMIERLNSMQDVYQLIELKDDPASTVNISALTLRVDIMLNNADTLEKSHEFTRDVLRLADHLVIFKMSRGTRERLQEKRAKTLMEAQKEKREEQQEELMKKKAEKQKEKEAKMANLSPEQQRKLEEKERKREMKRQNKKMYKVVKK